MVWIITDTCYIINTILWTHTGELKEAQIDPFGN